MKTMILVLVLMVSSTIAFSQEEEIEEPDYFKANSTNYDMLKWYLENDDPDTPMDSYQVMYVSNFQSIWNVLTMLCLLEPIDYEVAMQIVLDHYREPLFANHMSIDPQMNIVLALLLTHGTESGKIKSWDIRHTMKERGTCDEGALGYIRDLEKTLEECEKEEDKGKGE